MYALLYRSSASCSVTADLLSDLYAASQMRNGLWGITGVLLCCTSGDVHSFAQWLEGEEETVHDLYAHIRADTRHTACVVLASGDDLLAVTHGERLFGEWEMRVLDVGVLPMTVAEFLDVAAAADEVAG